MISGSAGSNDAMDIFGVINQLRKEHVAVFIMSLLGTMQLWNLIAQETEGRVFNTINYHTLEEILLVGLKGLR